SNKQALYPRYELIDEFRRSSGGQSFHIIKFSTFLDLYGASKKVVEEVRKEEVQAQIVRNQPIDSQLEAYMAEHAVFKWLKKAYPDEAIYFSRDGLFDFVVDDPNGAKIGVEVKYFRDAHKNIRRYKEAINQAEAYLEQSSFDNFILIFVGSTEKAGFALMQASKKIEYIPANSSIICG